MQSRILRRWAGLCFWIGATLLPLRLSAATVAVNSTADEVNGNTTSIANLIATPGGAGISLREAIIAANNTAGADTITLPAGTYTLTRAGNDATAQNGDLDINGSLTLVGAGAATTIIQAATDAVFTGSIGDKVIGINQDGTFLSLTVNISGVTIRYGRNTVPDGDPSFAYTGGGVDVFLTGTGNFVSFTNCVITGSENVNSYGGGVNIDSGNSGLGGDPAPGTANRGTVVFSGCTIASNKAKQIGGGFNLLSDSHNVIIENCSITNNTTTGPGGIAANGGGVNVRHAFNIASSVIIRGSTIANNSSASIGGGVCVAGANAAPVTIQNSTISGNSSGTNFGGSSFGGGLFNDSTVTTLTDIIIANNHADGGAAPIGGGIFCASSSVNMTGGRLSGNTSRQGGGAAVGNTGAGLTLSRVTVTNNTATVSGGGLFISTGTLTANFCRIVGNSAPTGSATAQTGGTASAANNWWGTNAPAARISGAVTFTPWLNLNHFANPGSVAQGNATTLTATFLTNSAGALQSAANLTALTGLPVTFNNAVRGTLSGAQSTIQASATATATFTGTVPGAGSANAVADGQPATAPVTILCPTVTATVSGSTNICAGQSATVIVTLSGGTGPYSVTLNNGGGTQAGAGPLIFNVTPASTTTYAVSSGNDANSCAVTGSGSAIVTVNANPTAPVISLTPTNPFANSTANQASGPAGATTYSWTITNGTITTATNLQTITYTAGASNNVGLTLRVSNASGCSATTQTNVPISAAFAIVLQPANTLACAGSTASFTVGANAPASIQWQKRAPDTTNFVNIANATNITYVTPPVSAVDDGSAFRALVSGGGTNLTSSNALLSVITVSSPTVSYNFNSGLPPNTATYGATFVSGGILELNTNVMSQSGAFLMPDLAPGQLVRGFAANFKVRMIRGGAENGDGFSFNWATDLPNTVYVTGEEGEGSGLRVCFDTYNNGFSEAPAIDVKWGTNVIGHYLTSNAFLPGAANDFADVSIRLNTDGTVDVSYRCVAIFSRLPIPGYAPLISARFGFGSRAGAAFESHSIDDLALQLFVDPTNGVPRITSVKTNGTGGLTIIGTGSPGAQLALNASTNLNSVANWRFRATVIPNGSGVFTFNEPNISTPTNRFYKLAAAPQLPTNLVTWWRAESNYLDSYGGNHGTSTNLGFAAGQRGQAFNFNGTNNAMTISGSPIPIPWTAAFWVRRHDAPGVSAALLTDISTGLKLEQAGTPRRVGFTQFGVADHSFNYVMPTNTWTHLTFVSRVGGTVLYTNGVVVETNAATINLPIGVMGALGGGSGDQLKAVLDETTLFNRALSPAEIQQVINATRGP